MSDDGKTEVEFAGVKFRGGKIFVIITALSTLGGGLYAGFEFWKDYMDMKEKIEKYTAPDLSGFDKRLAVLRADMDAMQKIENMIEDTALQTRDEARTIKNDLKAEIVRTERLVESIERRVKSIQDDTRKMIDKENDRNDKIRERIQNRMDGLDDTLTGKMKTLEKETGEKIKKALSNPLAGMRK
jgi:ribosomal protein L16 Arg81 hydroxylase